MPWGWAAALVNIAFPLLAKILGLLLYISLGMPALATVDRIASVAISKNPLGRLSYLG